MRSICANRRRSNSCNVDSEIAATSASVSRCQTSKAMGSLSRSSTEHPLVGRSLTTQRASEPMTGFFLEKTRSSSTSSGILSM